MFQKELSRLDKNDLKGQIDLYRPNELIPLHNFHPIEITPFCASYPDRLLA
jgi:hypothetical protein